MESTNSREIAQELRDEPAAKRLKRQIVKFDVGGSVYSVTQDLLDQHPETMLAKSVSETWHENPDEPVFLNGDGERFKYVLDYLRTGEVVLPSQVPKLAILKDLDFYGFHNVDPETITVDFAPQEVTFQAREMRQRYKRELKLHDKRRDCMVTAHYLWTMVVSEGSTAWEWDIYDGESPPMYQEFERMGVFNPGKPSCRALFNEELSKYGLVLDEYETSRREAPTFGQVPKFRISVKKLTHSR